MRFFDDELNVYPSDISHISFLSTTDSVTTQNPGSAACCDLSDSESETVVCRSDGSGTRPLRLRWTWRWSRRAAARRGAARLYGTRLYAHSGRGSQYEPRQGAHLLGAHRGCEGALLAVDDHALDKLDARRVDAVPLVRVRRVLAEEDMAEVAAARVAGELDAAHLRTHTHATTGLNVELPSWGCLAQGLWRGREA